MITIEPGKQHGYSKDIPVLKLTHSFTSKQLLQIAAMAVEVCGMEEVLRAIGQHQEDTRQKGHYQVVSHGEAVSRNVYFSEDDAVRAGERFANDKSQSVQVVHLVADITPVFERRPVKRVVDALITRRYR